MLQKVVNPSRENNKIKTASELSRAQWLKKEEVDDLKKPLTKQMIETLRPLQILNRFIDITEKRDEKQALRMLDILDQVKFLFEVWNERSNIVLFVPMITRQIGIIIIQIMFDMNMQESYDHQ
jgi:hypothetical protein